MPKRTSPAVASRSRSHAVGREAYTRLKRERAQEEKSKRLLRLRPTKREDPTAEKKNRQGDDSLQH